MMDPIVTLNLVAQCRAAYVSGRFNAALNPLISPLAAADTLLARFPPTSIMVGSFDPFLDDSVDFAHRLNALGVRADLRVISELPHSFLQFTVTLSAAANAAEGFAAWLRDAGRESGR